MMTAYEFCVKTLTASADSIAIGTVFAYTEYAGVSRKNPINAKELRYQRNSFANDHTRSKLE